MRFLVLWADDRATNLGVQALGAGTRSLLESLYPGAVVHEQSYGTRYCPRPMGSVRRASRELLIGRGVVVDWLKEYDVVIDTRAGDSFADIYGLRRLTVMNLMTEAVRRSGTPLVFGPQTIGPFESFAGRRLAKRALRQATAVIARDSASAQRSAQLGRPVDAIATDVVFALPIPVAQQTRDVILNVSGLLWQQQAHVDSGQYRRTVVELGQALRADGRQITLLPHVIDNPTPDNDVKVMDDVAAALGGDIEVVVPTSLGEVRQILAGGRLTIGSRMHACLNSLSVGVPTIPMAYSAKFAPLFSDIGWHRTVDLRLSGADAAKQVLNLSEAPGLEAEASAAVDEAHSRLDAAREVLRGVVEATAR